MARANLVISYRKGLLRVVETWFDEPAQAVDADVLRCVQRSQPTPDGTARRFYTLVIDMRQEPGILLARMNKETRYEIRRAEDRDYIACEVFGGTDAHSRNRFRSFYNAFTAERGLASVNEVKLEQFAKRGKLLLSVARAPDGEELVWHSYYNGDGRTRLLHSPTASSTSDKGKRALVGRANRLLHWRDISTFRGAGVDMYDFGGWHEGADSKKIDINQFKRGFGGEITLSYNCLCGLTRLGNAAVWFYSKFGPTTSV